MKARRDLDAFLAFLAGAGTGAALTRMYLGPASSPFAVPTAEIQRQGTTAASLGRIHSLLGEIRGLMKSPGRGAPAAGAPASGTQPPAAGGPAPRLPEAAPARAAEAPGPDAGGAAPAGADAAAPPRRDRAGDAWRRPDQVGYGRSPGLPWFGGAGKAGAALLAAAGAAAIVAVLRRGGSAAAWSAAGGVLAASLWSAWLEGPPGAGSGRPRGAGNWIDGRRGHRRGRSAVR